MPVVNSIRRSFNKKEELALSNSEKFKVTGGDKVYSAGGYTIHLFTETDNIGQFKIEPNPNLPADKMHLLSGGLGAEVLMVGGGGASGQYSGGGGGGEVLFISKDIAVGSYPTSVAASVAGDNGYGASAKDGRETTFLGETAKGGGSGRGSDDSYTPNNGTLTRVANGGAGSSRTSGYFGQQGSSVGTGVTRHGGYRGGQEGTDNNGPNFPGGGGGGSSQSRTGNTGGGGNGQPGGTGTAYSMTGTSYYWAGGGGGQTYYGGSGGAGGNGGGGGGSGGGGGGSGGAGYNPGQSRGSAQTGGAGGANTGGGGGGGNGQNGSAGGGGASGIIIVRYPQ